jgi:YD repeat-containing protein
MDIDGDGVAEYVTTSSNTNTITSIKRADADHPMRLLRSIDNGRGAVTTVAYTPTTDHSVVTPPTPPKHQMPHIQWVVKSMTTTDPFAVSSTTTYHYDSPHWSPDDQSRWGFRGFDVVRTTSPRNAVTEDRYDYSVDWSGRLATTLVFPAESPASPTTISETVFTPETLFGGAITTFHTSMTRQWTCSPGQTEAQCRATPAGFTKEASSWKPMASTTVTGGPTLLYVESEHTKQDSETFNDGDRTTKTTYALDADGTTYRLRDTDAVSQVQTAGALVTSARVHKQYDSLWKVAQLTTNWFDATHSAASERTYDMTTGNVTMTREPEQYAANKAAYTEYKYDSKALFVAITNDALKHKVSTVYDYGTGALLRTIGPNYTNCTGICSTQSEEKRTDVDGLGRPIATYVATDSSTPGQYVLAQVTSTSYVDVGTATSPASVTTQQRVEYDENRWTKEKVELDAHGRPFRKTTYVQGTAPNDAVTTYQYDAIGKLTQVSVPNPATNSTDTVTYSYGSDSIGRPTSMRRPGAAPQSGLDITYQGVQETRTEVAGTDGGPASVTQLVHDPFGRLAAVREQLDDGTWATTTYSYDPQDNVSQIADPDGLVTYLDHDWGSRRIGIRRGNRTWTFGYDRNGNLTSETAPPPSSSSADVLAYTTTYSYDDLDRVKSKLVGSRWLSSADQDLLGVGELDYSYDTGINGTGRLVQVTTEVAPLPWTVRGFRSRGERVTRFVLDG